MANLKIALAGNPNSGKTTLFNALTGSNQYVGNWPGVTVEKKVHHGCGGEGLVQLQGDEVGAGHLRGDGQRDTGILVGCAGEQGAGTAGASRRRSCTRSSSPRAWTWISAPSPRERSRWRTTGKASMALAVAIRLRSLVRSGSASHLLRPDSLWK